MIGFYFFPLHGKKENIVSEGQKNMASKKDLIMSTLSEKIKLVKVSLVQAYHTKCEPANIPCTGHSAERESLSC